jgi:hypothetical protein
LIAGVLLAQIGEFSLVVAGAAERGGVISRDLGQTIVAVMAFSLLLSPLWLLVTRRLLRVVILGMTSFHDTLDAIRSRRLAAVWHVMAAGFAFAWYLLKIAARGLRGIARLFRRRPRAEGETEAAEGRRHRAGDTLTPRERTLTPRGVADPDDVAETPRYPPPDGPPPAAAPASTRPPPAPQAAEEPRTPPAEILEPNTIPRRDSPSSALRRTPTGPAPETPRYPAPDSAPHSDASAPEKKGE